MTKNQFDVCRSFVTFTFLKIKGFHTANRQKIIFKLVTTLNKKTSIIKVGKIEII